MLSVILSLYQSARCSLDSLVSRLGVICLQLTNFRPFAEKDTPLEIDMPHMRPRILGGTLIAQHVWFVGEERMLSHCLSLLCVFFQLNVTAVKIN